MQFTSLKNVPVTATQLTPNMYGPKDEPEKREHGASLSVQITVPDGKIALENGKADSQLALWATDGESVSPESKVMNGSPYELEIPEGKEIEISISRKGTNDGKPIFTTRRGHKITVTDLKVLPNREVRWHAALSFRNTAETLFAAQGCTKRDDELVLTTRLVTSERSDG